MKYFNPITLLILLCIALPLWGQQNKNCDNIPPQYNRPENSVWAMSDSLGLDFNTSGGPSAIVTSLYENSGNFRNTASVADTNGNLLFYTNGWTVWSANGAVMQNGITGYGYLCQIVQIPYQPEKYYLFTISGMGLFCNLIDMSLNNGQGGIDNSFPLKGDPLGWNYDRGIAAISDCSRNVWVLIHDGGVAKFRAFHITAAGIDTVPVVSDFSGQLSYASGGGNGVDIEVSPDGKHIAYSIVVGNTSYKLTYYDFDPATGIVSNPQILKTRVGDFVLASSFSPDNSKLYCLTTQNDSTFVLQYDFNSTQPDSLIEPDLISGTVSSSGWGFRLGPDGKIYFASHWGYVQGHVGDSAFRAVGRINYPNNPAASCGFQDSVASVDFSSLPVTGFFTGFFPTQTVIPESSLQISVHLQGDTLFAQPNNFDSYQWYFNGNALTADTTAYLPVTDTGLYAVKVVDSSCGCTDSVVYHLSELPGLGIVPLGTNPIRVYPNPTKDKIFVPSPMALNLSLYDLTGRLLFQEKDKKQMDLSALPDGLYLLKIEDNQGRFIKMEKVVKRK